jgi:bacteriorhodopsin
MNLLLQSSSQQTWLWIGTIGMALGAVVIYALGGKGSQHHRVASVFVCAIAACMYLLMAFGQGDVIVTQDNLFFTPDGVVDVESASLVYWARYLDWVFTTPLLLIGLLTLGLRAVSGSGEAVRDRLGLIAGVIGADVLMIITGLFGALSMNSQHKYIWFAISCGFFLAVLAAVWGPAWFWTSLVLMILAHDAYFYWTHRLMHRPQLFRAFHRRHRRVNTWR